VHKKIIGEYKANVNSRDTHVLVEIRLAELLADGQAEPERTTPSEPHCMGCFPAPTADVGLAVLGFRARPVRRQQLASQRICVPYR